MEKFIGDGKVECVGLYIDTKGILLIFKTTSPKIKAEAQKYVDNMQKILNIEGPRLSDSCCAFDEYHRERVQQWMTHAKIAKDFVESDDEEEKEDCHILAKAETAIMQVGKASAATQKRINEQMALVTFDTSNTQVKGDLFLQSEAKAYEYRLQQECTIQLFSVGIWPVIDSTRCKCEKRRVKWLAERMQAYKTPNLVQAVKESVKLHKEGHLQPPKADKQTFWKRCTQSLQLVNITKTVAT